MIIPYIYFYATNLVAKSTNAFAGNRNGVKIKTDLIASHSDLPAEISVPLAYPRGL